MSKTFLRKCKQNVSKKDLQIEPYQFEPEKENSSANCNEASVNLGNEIEKSNDKVTKERAGNLSWCHCSKCLIETREIDCLCCHEVSAISEEQFCGNNCLTNSDEFNMLCLNRAFNSLFLTGEQQEISFLRSFLLTLEVLIQVLIFSSYFTVHYIVCFLQFQVMLRTSPFPSFKVAFLSGVKLNSAPYAESSGLPKQIVCIIGFTKKFPLQIVDPIFILSPKKTVPIEVLCFSIFLVFVNFMQLLKSKPITV